MKRVLAAFLTVVLLVGMLAISASAVKTGTKTYTLEPQYVESNVGSVTVKVTLNGYIGSLDMKACGIEDELLAANGWIDSTSAAGENVRDIFVLKSGSEVKFTITASDPNAYYNYCYTKGIMDLAEKAEAAGNTYAAIFDDCGGGVKYTLMGNGTLDNMPMTVVPNDDGTARLVTGGFDVASGRKISDTTYAYTAHDGLYSFAFQGKDKAGDPVMDSYGYEARYVLGTFLFVTDEQIEQMQEEGTMTFHKNLNNEFVVYDHAYPGLADLLKVDAPAQSGPVQKDPVEKEPDKTPKQALHAAFNDRKASEFDNGMSYSYTLENTTGEKLKGPYLLVTFESVKDNKDSYPYLQMFAMDINMKAGEKKEMELIAKTRSLSACDQVWIQFENTSERTKFLADSRLVYDKQTNSYELDYGDENKITVEQADGWFKEYLGVTLTAKN